MLLCSHQLYEHFYHFFHGSDGDAFVDAVEVHAAGGEVGAGQTHKGESCAVRAAADRYADGIKSYPAHGIFRCADDVHVGQDHFLHVVVAVAQIQLEGALAVDGIHVGNEVLHEFLAVLKLFAVVIADDHAEFGKAFIAVYRGDMVKSLVVFGVRGRFRRRHSCDKVAEHEDGVLHLVFRRAGMDVHAVHCDVRGCRVEVFVFDLGDLDRKSVV